MGIYAQWLEKTKNMSEKESQVFWVAYLEEEKNVYLKILANKIDTIQGVLKDVAESYNMDTNTFAGFLDGINDSLETHLDVETLEEDTVLDCKIVYLKLYVNMMEAKADWLYNLPEWDDIYSKEERMKLKKEFDRSKMATSTKVGRNDMCPCGSGKKYKKCCG